MRVLAISGSLRPDGHNAALLAAAARVAPPGVDVAVLDPALLKAVEPYDPADDAPGAVPPGAAALRDAVAAADALLLATPEYNGSVPGALKNALDWASRPFRAGSLTGTPAAVVGASTGLFGAVWAQAELRKVLATAGAGPVVDRDLPVGQADNAFTPQGDLADPDQATALRELVAELVATAGRRHAEAVAA